MTNTQEQKIILLTGSTGNFGSFLAKELLNNPNIHLCLLVRGTSSEQAHERVNEIINLAPERVNVYKSDLTQENLDLSPEICKDLMSRVNYILHSAATTRFNLSFEEARVHNVVTTKNILDFAKECPNLIRFGFLSTVYVSGKRTGLILEDEFEHGEGFSNTYQQSKYEAEALARSVSSFPIIIFRPPFIVSPDISKNPRAQKNFLSFLISFIAKGYLPIVPGSKESIMDIVDSYDAARAIVSIFLKDRLSFTTYQITNGKDALNIGTLHKFVEEKVGKSIPVEYCGGLDSFNKRLVEVSEQNPAIKEIYKRGESFLLEPAFSKVFDNKHTLSELGTSSLGEEPKATLKMIFNTEAWNLSE